MQRFVGTLSLLLASILLVGAIPSAAHAAARHHPRRVAHTQAPCEGQPRLVHKGHCSAEEGVTGAPVPACFSEAGLESTYLWVAAALFSRIRQTRAPPQRFREPSSIT